MGYEDIQRVRVSLENGRTGKKRMLLKQGKLPGSILFSDRAAMATKTSRMGKSRLPGKVEEHRHDERDDENDD
jgi:hypothetical protein